MAVSIRVVSELVSVLAANGLAVSASAPGGRQ